MHLYHTPGSRSTRVVWTLEEIGAPYEITTLRGPERRDEARRFGHPLGRVPLLELDDGQILFESAAICLQLADLHPEAGLIPAAPSTARGLVYQWTVFAMTEVEPKLFAWRAARRQGEDESSQVAAFEPIAAALRAALTEGPWLTGAAFTVADITNASILANLIGGDFLDESDPLLDYGRRALARPAYARRQAVDA